MHHLAPFAVLALITKAKLVSLIIVFGLATVVLFSVGFFCLALVINRNMREEEAALPHKKNVPNADIPKDIQKR